MKLYVYHKESTFSQTIFFHMENPNDDEPPSMIAIMDLVIEARRLEIAILRAELSFINIINALDRWLPPRPPPPTGPFYPIVKSKQKIQKATCKCAICYEKIPTTKLLPCKHAQFCKTCITRNSMISNRCPLCRANIDKAIVRSIDTAFVPTIKKPFLFGPWIP